MKNAITPWTQPLMDLFYRALSDDEPEVQCNAAFASGLLIEHSDMDLSPQYLQILTALRPIFVVAPDAPAAKFNARDNAVGALNVAKATVQSRQAAVARLEQMQSFERVEAPFDGTVTARTVDVGALINAGSGGSARELFHLVSTDWLRIYVSVPEINAPAIHIGATAQVTLDEFPGETFPGVVVRTSNAIDPTSRTLLVEVDVPNKDGKLLPGAYAHVLFTLPVTGNSVTVPANTLLFRKEGPQVGGVRDGKVELVPVKIGHDFGDSVEIVSGLSAADQIVVNPTDSLVSGTAVVVKADAVPAK